MQPINYMLDVQQPIQMAMQGYAQGQGLRAQQQGMEMQRQQMDMQRQQFEMAQQQIQQQQARAQEVQSMMGQFAELVRTGDVKPEDVIQMQFMVPEMAESIQGAYETLSDQQKEGKIQDLSKLAVAMKRNPELAFEMIDERILATENAGDPQALGVLKAIKSQAEMDPDAVTASVLMELATVMDKDQFENFMTIAMPEAAEPTDAVQTFQALAGMAGLEPGTPEYAAAAREAMQKGGTTVNVPVNLGDTLSPGFKRRDELFAAIDLDWQTGGGTDAVKQLAQLEDVISRIDAGEQVSGGVAGFSPDLVRAFIDPNAQDAKDTVEEVVQRNLRVILGAQFTAKEGEQLIARAFNPKLGKDANRKRLMRLFTQMRLAAEQKQAMSSYFNENGTLQGYTGTVPTLADFYAVLDGSSPEAAPQQTGRTAQTGQIPTIASQSAYEALPSGAEFIGADGKKYRKP
jgi:hypothetical protein